MSNSFIYLQVFALDPSIELEFLELATHCKAVICCRVTPLQKVSAKLLSVSSDTGTVDQSVKPFSSSTNIRRGLDLSTLVCLRCHAPRPPHVVPLCFPLLFSTPGLYLLYYLQVYISIYLVSCWIPRI